MASTSTFPQQIDVLPQWMNITQSDASLLKLFQTEMKNGNFTKANEYLSQIVNYDKKLLSASKLNKLSDCIGAIENFYTREIQPYITTKQTEWEDIIDKFSYFDVYNSASTYTKNNMVLYNNNGLDLIYICISENNITNKLPTDVLYWRQLTIQGAKGANGTNGISYNYEWSSSVEYNTDEIVSYNSKLWISKNINQNSEPSEVNTNWEKVLDIPQPTYPMQASEPTNLSNGDIWFQTLE